MKSIRDKTKKSGGDKTFLGQKMFQEGHVMGNTIVGMKKKIKGKQIGGVKYLRSKNVTHIYINIKYKTSKYMFKMCKKV